MNSFKYADTLHEAICAIKAAKGKLTKILEVDSKNELARDSKKQLKEINDKLEQYYFDIILENINAGGK